MDYVRDGKIQRQCAFKKTKERPCISPSLTLSMGKKPLEENEYSTVCSVSVMHSLIIFASGNQRSKDRFDDVAIEWTSWRDMNECVCGKAFEASTAANLGTHCRRCGKIFCERCIHRRILPCKDSEQPPNSVTTPICNACYL